MDRTGNILDKGFNHIENYFNQIDQKKWDKEIMKILTIASTTFIKAGIFVAKEIGYFFTGALTLPKERWVLDEDDKSGEKLRKLMKTVLPIIFGISIFFYSSVATPFLLTIAMPSIFIYSALMITKGVIKMGEWMYPLGNK